MTAKATEVLYSKTTEVLWGKSSGDNNEKWLPVWLHLRDSYQVAGWLWDNVIPLKHKKMIAEDQNLLEKESKALLMLLAGLHDIGKATPDFSGREKVVKTTSALKKRLDEHQFSYSQFESNRASNPIRHEIASVIFVKKFLKLSNTYSECFLAPISGHHGNPLRPSRPQSTSITLEKEWADSASELVNFIMRLDEINPSIIKKINESGISWRSQILLTGWLVCSDWIASNEKAFLHIPFETIPCMGTDYLPDRFESSIKNISIPTPFDPSRIPEEKNHDKLFSERFNIPNAQVRPMQKSFLDLVSDEKTNPIDIFVVEAPMGEGKTEAALLASEILMRRSGSQGIFFGLPTMATGEALYTRFTPYIQNLLIASKQQAPHDLAHSKSRLSEVFSNNIEGAKLNQEYGIVDAGWYNNKRTKHLIPFTVGTVDNFLMKSLKTKYPYFRHLGFSQKVIIVDEVHSMDAHMEEYLMASLRYAGFYECPVILLSATLKSERRQKFIEAYNEGKEMGTQCHH